MKKLLLLAGLLAALGARANDIVWGFGNYGFYSGYQLYGSILNPDPVLQGYIEVNVNLPFAVGPLDDLGYIGGGYWCNSDLTGRRNASYRRAFNENDPNVHWGKTFWFDGDAAGDFFSPQFLAFPDSGLIPVEYKRSPNPRIVIIAV